MLFKRILGKYYWPYVIISFICLTLYFNFFIIKTPSQACKEIFNRDFNMGYNGKVESKFLDSKEHYYKTVLLTTGNVFSKITFDWDKSGLYDFIQPDDSVYKKVMNDTIYLGRGDEEYVFIMNYGCDDR